jgi:hypothetical protein
LLVQTENQIFILQFQSISLTFKKSQKDFRKSWETKKNLSILTPSESTDTTQKNECLF